MNKMIMNRLTMLAVTLMASMACFAQGNYATSLPGAGLQPGDPFDYMGVKYEVISVLGTNNVYSTKAIGFETNLLNDFSKMDEEPMNNLLPIQHYVAPAGSSNGMLVASVEPNIFQTVDPELAAKITSLKIDDQSDDIFANGAIDALPTTGSTFAGLTGLTEVTCRIPGDKVAAISNNSFATNVYKTATLIVPDGAMGKYNNLSGWQNFMKIQDQAGNVLGDLNGDGAVKNKDYKTLLGMTGLTEGQVGFSPNADLNGDGKISNKDIKLMLAKIN